MGFGLDNLKVGDQIVMIGGYEKQTKVLRTVARVTKTLIIDNKGCKWSKKWGRTPGEQWSVYHIEPVTK